MATMTLNNGVKMPQEGFGVFQIDDLATCKLAVQDALDVGYRLIDTAQGYFNEEAVGAGIAASAVDRQDIFLTTKVWISNYGYEKTTKSIEESLKKLQTDYLDLVLIHQPFSDYYGAYQVLEDLYDEGKIRAIGVSNFLPDRFVDLAEFTRITPAVNQLETHVFFQQQEDRKYLDQYQTQIESWGPLAQGKNGLFTQPVLTQIGAKHAKTASQVALRYLTQQGVIIIPKSVHKKRMQENFDIWDFTLTNDELVQIKQLDTHKSEVIDYRDPESVRLFANYVK
ncbi:aldo/keto reductase [Bombilactobacillus thymidiniphilus]|uniref:Aldo/keto reductase n=1 Tax=Bombilactobacillus thymidiniphilus TaxID=2923363 RepID=A0ABY4PFM0_9LACO|nr:aldo/keto reductase [Bombilactobacillus thymidiniphilus]UQS84382.1 aldo/keto reductase [Bombilactobacillus thymidiniphilus]